MAWCSSVYARRPRGGQHEKELLPSRNVVLCLDYTSTTTCAVQCLLLKFFVCVCVCGAKASANWCKLFNRRPSREKRFAKGCNGATVGSLLKGPLCQAKKNASVRNIAKNKDFKKSTSFTRAASPSSEQAQRLVNADAAFGESRAAKFLSVISN